MGKENCPICQSACEASTIGDGHGNPINDVNCPRCGRYFIGLLAKETIIRALSLDNIGVSNYLSLKSDLIPGAATELYVEVAKKAADGKGTDLSRSIVSHVLRKNVRKRPATLETKQFVSILQNSYAPSPAELANNVVVFLGQSLSSPGTLVEMPSPHGENIYGLLGVKVGRAELEDLFFILTQLTSQKILQLTPDNRVSLTLAGWQRYEELLRSVKDSRRAFVAMEFPDESRSSDYFFQTTLLDKYLIPAVRQTGS